MPTDIIIYHNPACPLKFRDRVDEGLPSASCALAATRCDWCRAFALNASKASRIGSRSVLASSRGVEWRGNLLL